MIGLVAFASAFAISQAANAVDEVLSLPGWSGELPSKQYSGYLNASETSHLHYWLVMSESNPATDPLVLWFNGNLIKLNLWICYDNKYYCRLRWSWLLVAGRFFLRAWPIRNRWPRLQHTFFERVQMVHYGERSVH